MEKNRRIITCIFIIMLTIFWGCDKQSNQSSENEYTSQDSLSTKSDLETIELENAVPLDEHSNIPKLAIIIDDFGNYSNFMIDSLLVKFGNLPEEVAFAILPNLPYSEFVMEFFQFENRELLLHTPLEPQNTKINAGEVVITDTDDTITIINKLNDFYTALPAVKGLNNHMGSKATENVAVMTTILEWCKNNDLYFVDSATSPNSVAFNLAQELGVATAKRDIFLDVPNPTRATVDNYLIKMTKYYDSNRDILVITHASSLERRDNLLYFIEEAQKIGFRLVPASEYLISEKKPI